MAANDCLVCSGENGLHNAWMGKPCPREAKPLRVPSLKDLTREALSGSDAAREVEALERLWGLER